jgi:hypothetical protein
LFRFSHLRTLLSRWCISFTMPLTAIRALRLRTYRLILRISALMASSVISTFIKYVAAYRLAYHVPVQGLYARIAVPPVVELGRAHLALGQYRPAHPGALAQGQLVVPHPQACIVRRVSFHFYYICHISLLFLLLTVLIYRLQSIIKKAV